MANKKLISVFLGALMLMLAAGLPASALTQAEVGVLIRQILAQIAALQEHIAVLEEEERTGMPWCHTFNVNSGFADTGSIEVGHLHTALRKESISYVPDGINVYSSATAGAVAQFQARYGISQTGYAGPLTRGKLNELYGCKHIDGPYSISLVYPKGGQNLSLGDTVRIAWDSAGLSSSDKITIETYMPDNPYLNVKALTKSARASDGYYEWEIKEKTLPSTSYPATVRLRLTVNKRNISISSLDITVNSPTANETSSISLTYPRGGQRFFIGESVRVTWDSAGLSSSDKIIIETYMPDNPQLNIKTLTKSARASDGRYDWKIEEKTLPSSSYPATVRLKLTVNGKNISVASSDIFVSSTAEDQSGRISLVYPRGGEALFIEDTIRVTWDSAGLSDSDKATIEVYMPSNPLLNVKTITTSALAAQGYYEWKITERNLPSTSYPISVRIRISVNGKNISDASASDIMINVPGQGLTSISVTHPGGGEIFRIGDVPRITWTTAGFTASDRLTITAYMPDNPLLNIKTITTSVSATQGYYDWKITKHLSSEYYPAQLKIKIESADKNISASSGDFTIVDPEAE